MVDILIQNSEGSMFEPEYVPAPSIFQQTNHGDESKADMCNLLESFGKLSS